MGLLENTKGKVFMGKKFVVKINKNRCKGCRLCVEVCQQGNLVVSGQFNKLGYHYIEAAGNQCNGCRKCAIICPDAAIEIYLEEEQENTETSVEAR
jgi:2-oxoglutarate ferredoxin oxidoreductase subunit delta